MRITNLETVPVEIPLQCEEGLNISPYITGTSFTEIEDTYNFTEAIEQSTGRTNVRKLLIRIDTNTDVVGWSEMQVPSIRFGQIIFEELIAPDLLGHSIFDIESFVNAYESFNSRYYIDLTAYLGAAELAMWDAMGKYLQQPVYNLIGGKRTESVPIAFCLGLMSPKKARKLAQFAYDEGFSVLKAKGSRYWKKDVERVIAMHDEVNGDLEFRLDPNQLWGYENAVRVGAELEDAGVYLQYLEQPVRIDSYGTLKRLRERLQTPIAVNEDAYFQRNIFQIGCEDAIDAAVVDTVPAGGILGIKRLAGVAKDMGISLSHHSNFDLGIKNAAKLHVCASTPTMNLPIDSVYYAYDDYILKNPIEIKDGRMVVPDDPGLASVSVEKVEEYRID